MLRAVRFAQVVQLRQVWVGWPGARAGKGRRRQVEVGSAEGMGNGAPREMETASGKATCFGIGAAAV